MTVILCAAVHPYTPADDGNRPTPQHHENALVLCFYNFQSLVTKNERFSCGQSFPLEAVRFPFEIIILMYSRRFLVVYHRNKSEHTTDIVTSTTCEKRSKD